MKKRFLSAIMAVGVLLSGGLAPAMQFARVYADDLETVVATSTYEKEETQLLEENAQEKSEYEVLKGEIKEISYDAAQKFIWLIREDGGDFVLLITEKTVLSDVDGLIQLDGLKVGDKVTGYFIQPQIISMQYPPKVESFAIVKQDIQSGKSLYVGMFGENHLALDNALKLDLSEKTSIIDVDGNTYQGSLVDKMLIVYYSMTTRSIPPQTAPKKVIVLSNGPQDQVEPQGQAKPQDGMDLANIQKLPIFVDNQHIENISAYAKEDGTIMVPIRAISEAMGFEVSWNELLEKVQVGTAIFMVIDENSYTVGRAVPRELEAAPELKDSRTYVPTTFFTDIMMARFSVAEGTLAFFSPVNDGADIALVD